MKVGLMFANAGPWSRPDSAVVLATAAERHGFDSLWAVEHVVVPDGYESTYPYSGSGRMPGADSTPIPDPIVHLSYVAARTSTISLATGILILPQRVPGVVAKTTATLDQFSGGRFLLGIGVGWLEEEFDGLGIPFADRGARTDDYVAALRALWGPGPASHHGEFVSFDDLWCEPSPVAGTIPIHVGGHSPAAARRAGRLGDGFFPAKGDIGELVKVMVATAEEAGRDPALIEVTTGAGPADDLGALADKGVHRVVTLPPFVPDDEMDDALAEMARQFGIGG